MGFYAPSQLVQDARRHKVEVLPVDVMVSDWDAVLEAGSQPPRPAVRLGLNLVRSLSREAAWRIEEARAIRPYTDVQDLALRAQLERADLQALAAANALSALSGNRRQALWQALAGAPDKGLLRHAPVAEQAPLLAAPSEAQDIAGDYHSMGLTLGRHPVALLRKRLLEKRFMPAEVLQTYANGQFARACGIVTVRQRPETAHGVLFMTLEDETGLVNVIVWPSLVEQQRREVLGAALLGVYGIWQNEQGVMSLVAKRLVDLSGWLGRVETRSRDFA
jgi:error-prone DNA polymerase